MAEHDVILGEESIDSLVEKVRIDSVSDIFRAALNMKHIAGVRGMRVGLCDNIASGRPMTDEFGTNVNADILGWEGNIDAWLNDPCVALHSPMPQACRFLGEPFWSNRRGFHGCPPNPYLDQFDLDRFFTGKIKNYAVMMVPVHLPFGQISANSFNPVDLSVGDLSLQISKYGKLFESITRRFISDYVNVSYNLSGIANHCTLSKREVECLTWAARGKTDSEAAQIIDISGSTVRFHIVNASKKLGSTNRAQSIFKATQLGYLKTSFRHLH